MNKNVNKHVEEIIKTDKYSRMDDWYLIAQVFKNMIPRLKGVDIIYALEHAKHFNLPSAESITRARRKIQDKYPQYKELKDVREREEREYHEFYGGHYET